MNAPLEGEDQAKRSRELVETGSELLGATSGAALGLIGGPPGALAGAAGGVIVTRVLKQVGAEVQRRWSTPRQRVRMGAAFATALDEIAARLESGQIPREDSFFDGSPRSDATELLEGVLLHAAQEYQERKVPYLGRFYASLAFREDVDAAQAHFLLQLAERLTYRQLVMLSIFTRSHEDRAKLGAAVSSSHPTTLRPSGEGYEELDDLLRLGVLQMPPQPGKLLLSLHVTLTEVSFMEVPVTSAGELLAEMCGVAEVPELEVLAVFRELHRDPPEELDLATSADPDNWS